MALSTSMQHLPAMVASAAARWGTGLYNPLVVATRSIRIRHKDWLAMQEHVRSCLPEEACGLLGGIGEQVYLVVPITNLLHSPARYQMEPREQVRAMLRMEDLGYEILGIYHSHPDGPSGPSETDLEEVTYPEIAHLIWWPTTDGWRCRAFDLSAEPVKQIILLKSEA